MNSAVTLTASSPSRSFVTASANALVARPLISRMLG